MNENTINADVTMGGPNGVLLAGRYRVVRQLGQGGMGSVWLAEDTALDNRQVAIKMLPSVLLSNERAYRQIKSEALLSLKLIHSNIAPIRSFEENNGNPFLVEDYIRGKNLDACLAEWGTLSEEETIALLKPVAEAIDYAHSAKVVHRDIKPANIMIREDGTPFVLDFGIAREMQETMTKVTGKLSSGTLMYMSPEQLKGAAPAPSQDVYSFAAMAYECLCGHPPFHRGQIEYQIVNETPEPLPFDSALSRKIMSALSKSPDERPDSCFSVLDVALSTAKKEDADEKATASVAKSSVDKQKQNTVKIFRKPFIWAVAFLIGLLVIALLEKVGDAKVPATRDARTESIIADKETAEKIRKDNAKEAIRLCEGGEWDAAFELSLKSDRSDQVLQYWIGCMYADGQGVAKDDAEAVKWFRKAAEQGEAEAQNRLGLMYRSGKGVAKDEAEAAKWYRKAAEQGLVGAQINLGWTYAKGRGVVKDDAEAAKWFRRAAEQGDAAIQNWLGRMYEEGNGVAKNEVEAVRWYRMAAEQGDVNAQFNMGRMCVNGRGVEKDDREAVKWFRMVAEKGDAGGQNWLGAMYKNGWGVAKDESEAVKWYRKAAEQGLANGQFNLGTCYLEGYGIAKDETEAVRWYRKAAEGGDAYAQCRLGVYYALGCVVEKDETEAVRWYRKSAEQGNAGAQCRLGQCYELGMGVAEDEAEAVSWYRKAVEQGEAEAQNNLGRMYQDGRGVAKNEAEAVKLFESAAKQGFKEAEEMLTRLKAQTDNHENMEEHKAVETARKPTAGEMLKLVATVDGKEVRLAKVKVGDKTETTPTFKANLKKGDVIGPFEVTYENDGNKYSGRFSAITVDWNGTKTYTFPLKRIEKIVEPSPSTDMELINSIRTTENLRREALDVQAKREIAAARKAMEDKEYDEVVRHYGLALKLLADRSANKNYRKECDAGIAEGLYRAALQEDSFGRRDRAVALMEKARDMRHPKARDQLEKWKRKGGVQGNDLDDLLRDLEGSR